MEYLGSVFQFFIAILCFSIAAFMFRILIDLVRKGPNVVFAARRKGYNIKSWWYSRVPEADANLPSQSVSAGLASVSENGKVYPKFETAPTESGMF